MGDTMADMMIQNGAKQAQDTPSQVQSGASIVGDAIEKSARANLETGENQRANDLQPVNRQKMIADMQDKHAEMMLKQQQFQDKQLEMHGKAINSAMGLYQDYMLMDPAFQKTTAGKARAQRVADLFSQGGMPHTVDDIVAGGNSDEYRAKFQAAMTDVTNADPKIAAKAWMQLKDLGISADEVPENLQKNVATLNDQTLKNKGQLESSIALATGKVQSSQISADARVESAQLAVDAKEKAKKDAYVNTTLPKLRDQLGKDYQQLKSDPISQKMVPLETVSDLVKLDGQFKTGIGQVSSLEALSRSMSGRFNDTQFQNALGGAGKINTYLNYINHAIGTADTNGNVNFKNMPKAQYAEIRKVADIAKNDVQQHVTDVLGPIYHRGLELQKEADANGGNFDLRDVMPEKEINAMKAIDQSWTKNPVTGDYQKTQAPGAKATTTKNTGPATSYANLARLKGITNQTDQVSLVNALKRNVPLDKLNQTMKAKGWKTLSPADVIRIKKFNGIQ